MEADCVRPTRPSRWIKNVMPGRWSNRSCPADVRARSCPAGPRTKRTHLRIIVGGYEEQCKPQCIVIQAVLEVDARGASEKRVPPITGLGKVIDFVRELRRWVGHGWSASRDKGGDSVSGYYSQ